MPDVVGGLIAEAEGERRPAQQAEGRGLLGAQVLGDREAVDVGRFAALRLVVEAVEELEARLILAGRQVDMRRQLDRGVGVAVGVRHRHHVEHRAEIAVARQRDPPRDALDLALGSAGTPVSSVRPVSRSAVSQACSACGSVMIARCSKVGIAAGEVGRVPQPRRAAPGRFRALAARVAVEPARVEQADVAVRRPHQPQRAGRGHLDPLRRRGPAAGGTGRRCARA